MSITTVTTKGQITIPRDIRQSLGLSQGDKVLFILEGDRAVLMPLPKGRQLSDLRGSLPATRPYSSHDAVRQEIQSRLGERIQRGEE
jgi:antitoxin PrlF